jgi:hypothetical protein
MAGTAHAVGGLRAIHFARLQINRSRIWAVLAVPVVPSW